MPEGPEVRRAAVLLDDALAGKPLVSLSTRLKKTLAWLDANGNPFPGRTVERVWSHGKWLVGDVEGGLLGLGSATIRFESIPEMTMCSAQASACAARFGVAAIPPKARRAEMITSLATVMLKAPMTAEISWSKRFEIL